MRERATVVGDILASLDAMARERTPANLNRLAVESRLSFSDLDVFLDQMARRGLVSGAKAPKLTLLGALFLEEYRAWVKAQERFGLQVVIHVPPPRRDAPTQTGTARGDAPTQPGTPRADAPTQAGTPVASTAREPPTPTPPAAAATPRL